MRAGAAPGIPLSLLFNFGSLILLATTMPPAQVSKRKVNWGAYKIRQQQERLASSSASSAQK
jgi:hypothetical protein